MSDESKNKRDFYRIEDRLPIEFRIISREEFLRFRDVIRYRSTSVAEKSQETRFLKENLLPDDDIEKNQILLYLQELNRKLDMILDIIGKSTEEEHYSNLFTKVSISGSGMRFVSNMPIKSDDFLDTRIVLPIVPYPKIRALGQAVRVGEARIGELMQWDVGLKFTTMNERDHDLLISYIFTKDREMLRKRHEI